MGSMQRLMDKPVFTQACVVQDDEVVQMASQRHNVDNSRGSALTTCEEKHHKACSFEEAFTVLTHTVSQS